MGKYKHVDEKIRTHYQYSEILLRITLKFYLDIHDTVRKDVGK